MCCWCVYVYGIDHSNVSVYMFVCVCMVESMGKVCVCELG